MFCGGSFGAGDDYRNAAAALGAEIAQRGMGLVYGGASVGLMGQLAQAVLDAGGEVIGVIPEALLEDEHARLDLTELHVVASMHDRKRLMGELADCFLAMPGGLGTLDELAEILTWGQLGFHGKPVGLLNVSGYFDRLLAFLRHAIAERFLTADDLSFLHVAATPKAVLDGIVSADVALAEDLR